MLACSGPDVPAAEVMHELPGPVLTPLANVVRDDPPRGEVMGSHAPGTATAQQLEHRMQDCTRGLGLGPPCGCRFGHEGLDHAPFLVAESGRRRLSRLHGGAYPSSHPAVENFLDTLFARDRPARPPASCDEATDAFACATTWRVAHLPSRRLRQWASRGRFPTAVPFKRRGADLFPRPDFHRLEHSVLDWTRQWSSGCRTSG